MELAHYGVTVNAVAPGALTRMTSNLGMGRRNAERDPNEFNPADPDNIAPLVVWLGSAESRDITGRVFNVMGGHIDVAEGWRHGPGVDQSTRWDPNDLGKVIPDLVAQAEPNTRAGGAPPPKK